MPVRILSCLLLLTCVAVSAGPVERVEPPSWWTGYQHRELQIMLHGDNLGRYRVSVEAPGVELLRTVAVESPNYLFVYLEIAPDAPAEPFDLVLTNGGDAVTVAYPLQRKSNDPGHARGFDASDVLYLITPDRFANGNAANDNVAGYGDPVDRSDWTGRHGGDLAGIGNALGYIADLGFTAIWLNPVLENAMPQVSYHGYSTTDFYKVDPRFGSNEDYRKLAARARRHGVGLIMDMIVNHIGSEHWWMDDLPTADWINFGNEYVPSNHARTTWIDPYASDYDRRHFADGWFVRSMPDLNQRNPLLGDYLIQNAIWWIEYLGLAGIRMDTYPYPDRDYMAQWTRRIMTEYPAFTIVGEEWSMNPAVVSAWQRGKDNADGYQSWLPGLMDFPLRETLRDVLIAPEPPWGSAWTPLYERLADDIQYPDPSSLVIFPDNHDMSRIFTQLGEDRDLLLMNLAFVATMRGIPQIFYGTEILMANRGSEEHGLIRSDYPGGWPGDAIDAFSGKGLTQAQLETRAALRRLLRWRRESPVIHRGRLMHFHPQGEVYTYFRYDDQASVMVSFNRGREPAALPLSQYAERLAGWGGGTDVLTGQAYRFRDGVTLQPRSVIVLDLHP